MAAGYRNGFVRDSTTAETYVVGSTAGTGTLKRGLLRRTDDGSDALMIAAATTGGFRAGFVRSAADPATGAVSAVQETTVDFAVPIIPNANVAWRAGFLREISTGRIVWILAGVANANARMWNGFLRTSRGDLVLD